MKTRLLLATALLSLTGLQAQAAPSAGHPYGVNIDSIVATGAPVAATRAVAALDNPYGVPPVAQADTHLSRDQVAADLRAAAQSASTVQARVTRAAHAFPVGMAETSSAIGE